MKALTASLVISCVLITGLVSAAFAAKGCSPLCGHCVDPGNGVPPYCLYKIDPDASSGMDIRILNANPDLAKKIEELIAKEKK